jgi:hypothetical protein
MGYGLWAMGYGPDASQHQGLQIKTGTSIIVFLI